MGQNDFAWFTVPFPNEFNIVSFILINLLVSRCAIRLKKSKRIAEESKEPEKKINLTKAEVQSVLSLAQLEEFHRRGVLVIRNFLSADEVAAARTGFHDYLRGRGIDPNNLEETANKLSTLSSTGGSGGVIDVFYQNWKLTLNEDPRAVAIMGQLWEATFAKCEEPYLHPYGPFNSKECLMYIDRVCYRVPDRISELHCSDGNKKRCLQRSLTPHIDCCPHRMFQDIGEYKYSKWRPIQAFISLTGTPTKDMGGFEACPGLHLEFEEWTKRRIPNPIKLKKKIIPQKKRNKNKDNDDCNNHRNGDGNGASSNGSDVVDTSVIRIAIEHEIERDISTGDGITKINDEIPIGTEPPCVGQFTPIRMIEDADIISRFEHIPCGPGDMVFWDSRIPHSNSYKNTSDITREAVYIGLLPNIELNREYIKDQLIRYNAGVVPVDQWHSHNEPQLCDYPFSPSGRKLVGLEPW